MRPIRGLHALLHHTLVPQAASNGLAVCMECRVVSCGKGEIVNISVDEPVMTGGEADAAKGAPICFAPFDHAYKKSTKDGMLIMKYHCFSRFCGVTAKYCLAGHAEGLIKCSLLS